MTDNTKAIQLAVIEGGHPFDVPNFNRFFWSMEGVETYQQSFDNWCEDWGQCRNSYDAILFYNMTMELPEEAEHPFNMAVNSLGETGMGVFVLHHSILSFPKNETWRALTGLEDSAFDYHIGEDVTIDAAKDGHPITEGLGSWEMHDETYTMAGPGAGSETLFTADHPKSMKTVGWTRTHRNARVFCFQPGHDKIAWACPEFHEVVHRGIRWVARKL